MHLKRLELQGYKTFAAKTDFEFGPGITAIVGPNGSGKSNIADALRWVMGEQRYGALRARRSEDMIFGGSRGRKPLGMADVSLTLDNSDGWLPIDYTEVTVQRRAFRSGENQYYLNGNRVRLRDIVELLAQGGLSSNTYTIIGQGAVDASLSMRPVERRAIFEEAAGIAIYQAKRDRSLAKLEDMRNNVVRVNDIIGEIGPRLERLNKRAEKAKRYQRESRELEKLLEVWYGYRWRKAQERLELSTSEESQAQVTLADLKRGLQETSERIDQLRQQQAELRGEVGRWHNESSVLHGRLEELQRELAVKRERQRLLVQQRDEIAQEVSPLLARRQARLERIDELEGELEGLTQQREAREAEMEALLEEMNQLQAERSRLEDQRSAAQDRAFELATQLAEARNRLSQLEARKEELNRERAEHEEATDDLESQRDRLAEQITNLETERDAMVATLQERKAEEKEKEAAAQSSIERQSELKAQSMKIREALGRLETRHELLTRLHRDLAGYSEGVRTLLGRKEDLQGLVATVAELIEVPAHLERAVEAAAGSLLQAVVVQTWQDAEAALRVLEESDGGQAALLPLDSLQVSSAEDVPDGEGVLGLASRLVGVGEGLEAALEAVLGHTLVVEDLDTARSLHRRHRDLDVVTLTGQVISRDGLLKGGSEASGGGLLTRQREGRELPEKIETLRLDEEGLQEEVESEEQLHQGLLSEAADLRQEYQKLQEAIEAKQEEIGSWRLRGERASQEIEWHRIAEGRLQDELQALDRRKQAIAQEVEGAERKQRETAEALESIQERLASLDAASLQEKLGELKTAVAVLKRGSESQEAALEGHRSSLMQTESQITTKEARGAELAEEAEELENAITALNAQIAELSEKLENVAASIGPAEEEISALEVEQRRLEKEEVKGRKGLEGQEAAYNKAILERQRCEDELRNLQERIEADLEMVAVPTDWPRQLPLDIDARLQSLPVVTQIPEGLEAKLKRLRSRVRRLGPVDLDSVSEYEQVLERHSFLVGQVEDLEKASRSLRKVVRELDRVMEERFLETFNGVAREFANYFPRLFNGGSGQLLLNDPEHPLQSGIDIVARPPRRRGGNVSVLSGGERALTGVALTLAILSVCGTPFCLLDEVDSRLDEINVARFSEELKELAERTQVIIITHNRLTVENADTIYGITMGGDSTSRVLSLRLDEVDAKAS